MMGQVETPLFLTSYLIPHYFHCIALHCRSFQVKRFQGISKYTKGAKIEAAKKAMTKLRSYMPGY